MFDVFLEVTINEKGKLQGRSRSQFNEVTHFRILKREEM